MKNTVMKCPMCPIFFAHEKYVLSHLVRCHAHAVDLLAPWKIPKRRRGSNMPQIQEMVYEENLAMGLPVKKRLALIIHVARQHRLYICHVCGRSYTEATALDGHKARHTLTHFFPNI